MKKMLIHTEYFCVLNLVALPFLIMFYEKGTLMFWALLIFLDGAELMLRIDEGAVAQALLEPQWKQQTQRIKIYLIGAILFYLLILFTKPFQLLIILLLNEVISSILSWALHHYILKDETPE